MESNVFFQNGDLSFGADGTKDTGSSKSAPAISLNNVTWQRIAILTSIALFLYIINSKIKTK